MSISKDDYSKMTDNASPNSPKLLNCIKAFLFGGGICLFGQILFTVFQNAGLNEKEVSSATSSVLIIITAILTGAGVFDKIARQAGAGTIVPITGFANSVVSPAVLQTALYPPHLNGNTKVSFSARQHKCFQLPAL